MLRITIELVPFGDESRARRIGSASIANIGSTKSNVGDYRFRFEQEPWQGRVYGPYVGRIQNWPRKHCCAWNLVQEALRRGLKRSPSTRTAVAQSRHTEQRLDVPPWTYVLRSRERGDLYGAMKRRDMLTAEKVAELGGVTAATVSAWRRSGRLIGIGEGRRFRYPACQLDQSGRPFTSVQEVLQVLGGDHWSAWLLLVNQLPQTGMMGYQALVLGQTSELQAAASWLVRFREILDKASVLMGGIRFGEEWLQSPAKALDGDIPIDLLTTEEGLQRVRSLLVRLEYCVYT